MFLRRNRRTTNGECYEYWTLVKTVRTAKGPRQEIGATLGKEPGLDSARRHGWEQVGDLLEGRRPGPVQGEPGQPMAPGSARPWAQVDLRGMRVERVREFGQVLKLHPKPIPVPFQEMLAKPLLVRLQYVQAAIRGGRR